MNLNISFFDIIIILIYVFFVPKICIYFYYKNKEEEWAEDEYDIQMVGEAIAESERDGFVSWEEFGRRLEAIDETLI